MTTDDRVPMTGGPGTDSQKTAREDAAFEAFLAPARQSVALSDDLMSRILADAARVRGPEPQAAMAVAPKRGLMAGLVAALGGWQAVTGMTAATLAGVWMGFSSPALLETTGLYASDYTISDLMPSAVLAMATTEAQ